MILKGDAFFMINGGKIQKGWRGCMKKRFISIMMAITVVFSSVGGNNFMIYADDFSDEEVLPLDDESDITVDTEEPENLQAEEADISEETLDDENDPDITIEDDIEEEVGEDLEFSDSGELFTDSDESELFSAGTQSSSTPEYEVWLSNTIISGLKMNGTTYGNSMYEILKEMQEPIYEELGGLILNDVPLMSISSVWNDVVKREFYKNQKLIYETLLVEYIKYENKTNAEEFDTAQIDRSNAFLIKIFNELADGGVQDWKPEEFMNMTVEEAARSMEQVQWMKDTVKQTKNISKGVKEFVTLTADILALKDAKQEKVQLIKNARDACAGMGNPNSDFIDACNEIMEEIGNADIDANYVKTQAADVVMDVVIGKVWSKLCDKNAVLKSIDWSADAMDILFNTSDAASNNLKLSILYTMDCYFKMGLSNAATSYLSNPTDKETAQTFNSCFDGYVNFQIYGNHTAKSWISSVTDDGALNHAFTYIFCREALKSAEELKNLCDSQNKTRNQMLSIVGKYKGVYSNLYMKDEYKQALSVPVTPTPAIDPKDYKISEGLTSPNPQVDEGKCGPYAYWKLFNDGTVIIYGKGGFSGYEFKLRSDKIKRVEISKGITAMNDWTFWCMDRLESITIPEGITSINAYTFNGCSNLKKIELPAGIKAIGYSAFDGCSSLKSITLPKEITSINERTFFGCTSLENIVLPEGITNIGEKAFWGCNNLKSVIIPNGVFNISKEAFTGCSSLENVMIPEGVTDIGDYAFKNCISLEQVTILKGITNIGRSVFENCNSLESVILPEGVKKIDVDAFKSCSSLKSIILPKEIEEIEMDAFRNCSSLENITLPERIIRIDGGAFMGCSSLENIILPKGMTKVEADTFRDCVNLKNVVILEGITDIEAEAFYGCSNLEKIVLPESVTRIEEAAFYDCKNLKSIVIPDSVVEMYKETFDNCPNLSICGHTGSYAERYAKENNIPFVDLDAKKDDVTVKPTATPQKPSSKPAAKEPAVLKLNVTTVTLQKKQSTTGLKITDMAKWDSVVSWKSSNTKIVKVSKTGKLTAQNKTGKAVVTVTLKSGLSKKVIVKVQKAPVGTIKITGLKKAVTLAKGKTLQLKPVRQPFTCREKITYTSSNKKVVSVNSKGKIKALKPGKAKITVKSGKKKFIITVTVKMK